MRARARARRPAPEAVVTREPAGPIRNAWPAFAAIALTWAVLFAPQLFQRQVFTLGDTRVFRPFAEFSRERWLSLHQRSFFDPNEDLRFEAMIATWLAYSEAVPEGPTPATDAECLACYAWLEARLAPTFDEAALEAMTSRPKLRVLQPGPGPAQLDLDARPITGGFLVQTADQTGGTLGESRVVTAKVPDEATFKDLQFAWTVVKHVRSNAIVIAHEGAAVGTGAGQMSRVEAVELAVHRAGPRAAGSVLASDGFFPYPDGVEVAARAGVRAIVQPGGSVKDSEAIAAADNAGMAMVFTGERHFKH